MQEVKEMEEELKEKEQLIRNYTAQLVEWQKEFKKMKDMQLEVLESVVAVNPLEEEDFYEDEGQ